MIDNESHSTNRTTRTNDSTKSHSKSHCTTTSKHTKPDITDQVSRTPTTSVRFKGEKSVQGECSARKGEKHQEKHYDDTAYRSDLKEWKQFLRHQIRLSAGL